MNLLFLIKCANISCVNCLNAECIQLWLLKSQLGIEGIVITPNNSTELMTIVIITLKQVLLSDI